MVLNLPAGAQLNYTVKTTLPTAQMSMSVDCTVTATPPRGYLDTNPIDNVASNSVLIVPAGPDLVVTVTETKSPTDTTVSYAINVHNNGPGPADGATVTYDIPAGATLQAVSAGPGWTCLSTMQRVTCTRTAPIGANEDASPDLHQGTATGRSPDPFLSRSPSLAPTVRAVPSRTLTPAATPFLAPPMWRSFGCRGAVWPSAAASVTPRASLHTQGPWRCSLCCSLAVRF